MNIDVRTAAEKERAAKHARICDMYLALSNKMPDCTPNRLFEAIAREFKMTLPGVRNIIIQNNLYTPRS